MWKSLVVLAIVASSILINPSEGTHPSPYSSKSVHGKRHRKCKNPNEVYDLCLNPCPPLECGVNKALILCAPPPKDCVAGCRCRDKYLRNRAGICIPEDECKYDCAKNETLDPCYSDCPPRQCGVNIAAVSCLAIDEEDCVPGCRCSDGYLKNAEGLCVLEEDCPKCTNQYEVYDICPAPCPPRRCDVDDRLIDCKPPPRPGDPECEPGCRCADGYARNATGTCIPRDQCPKCPGPYEVYDVCPAPCPPQRCDVDPRVIRCAAPPNPGDPECQPGCRCIDGYVRNAAGVCIPREQCPQNQCGKHEIYSECPANECRPLDCSEVGYGPVPCPGLGDDECPVEPGCICDYDYVRNSYGKCVRMTKCPSCGGDPNAISGSGVNCGKRCSDRNNTEPVACIDIYYENACDCRDNYFYDDNTGKCVLSEDCTPTCGENEILSNCSNGGCGPWTCSDVGFPTGCVKMDQKYCKVGCVCIDGYVKDEDGVCIPATDCPECGGDPNAIAGCGINCGRLCSNYNKGPVACTLECRRNACDCRKKYVYDENTQKCVKPKDCTPTCGKNEVFSECINGGCDAKNCSQLGEAVPCVRPAKCIQGCLCAEGYLRAANGTCIPKDQCPPNCKRPNEVYDPCPPSCPPQTCESLNKKYFCPLMPTNGTSCRGQCRCKPNYLRNKIGECIAAKNCLKCTGPNEYWSCGGACDNVCKTLSEQNQTNCPIINIKCNEMCYCEEGYARNDSNICIPIKECPGKCGKNEVWNQCPAKLCTPQSCRDLGFEIPCPDPDNSTCPGPPGCVCDFNYVRDHKGNCIPKQDCPSCGGDPNAQSGCGLNCGRLCSNYDKGPVPCPRICFPNACDCKKGYVYDENTKKCVLPKHCTPVCKEHEVYSECTNGGCQARNCSQLGTPIPCVKLDPKSCIKGCVCEEGYLRARNGTCVPEKDCDNCKRPNEVYDPCPPSCPPQTCESLNQKYFCPLMRINGTSCRGECRCKPNYLRNKIGECILAKNCLKCTGPNEYWSCGGACDNVCKTLSEQNQTNCPIINIKCNEMCYCEEGYARNDSNICIPIKECPGKCGKNEVWNQCPAKLCTPQSCKDLGFEIPCPDPDNSTCPGPPGCVCDFNYVRDHKGNCIPKQKCPSCGGDPNAQSGCGLNCGRLCSNYDKGPVPCPRICLPNACDCKKEYVYDENTKKCVLPKHCTPVCKEHEVYSECTNGGCQARNCSQLGTPIPCVKLDPKSCIKGCVCEEGYLRATNGTCVPEKDCDNCNKPHEHYDPCAPTCPPQTCESIGKTYHCPLQLTVCKGACRCNKGYYRNKIGECISKKNCLKCQGPHEYFSCKGACDNVCATLHKQNQTNCPIVNIKCNPMCYCEKGYARDKNNICIPIDKCPKPRCGVNERLVDCPPALCEPQKCTELGFPIACPDLPEYGCPEPPGCVCIDGYVRNSRGKCVPKSSCPSCGGDPHAEAGCGVNCGRTCELYNRTDIACIAVCYFNACDCRKGYVLDENLNKCVRPKDCTPICKKNEVYDTCANGGCGKRNCSQLGQPDLCIDVIECIGGCVCQEGFLRAKNGTCVPKQECPIPQCPKNERFEFCPDSLCDAQTCSQLGFPIDCPALSIDSASACLGEPACICDYGYVRNNKGKCVLKKKCPSCGGDPHAESGCGINCGRLCSNYNQGPVACPKICKVNSCDCKKGYVYDTNTKKCVKPEQCTLPCGKNEVFSECINGGCQPKNCSQLGKPVPCIKIDPKYCIKGCLCKEGYLRDKNGVCVPKEECDRNCWDPNEIYDPCPPSWPPQTCESIGKDYSHSLKLNDDKKCKGACRCKKGYYRNKIGECISKQNCLKCSGPNEYWSCGGACDNVCATLSKQNQTNCPIINIKCNEMCYCAKGHARDKNNICIPVDQCPPTTCGENERLEDCPDWLCSPQSCSQVGFPIDCPALSGDTSNPDTCPGQPACVCEDNYVRDDDGYCIPIYECPSCGGDSNAVSGCGVNCGRLCSNYKQKNVVCPLYCKLNGCDCRKGYVYDSNINKCVRPKHCTPTCGKYEVWDICANGGCQKRNCSQVGGPILCIDPIKCIGGCVCQEGYLRNKNGDCIPQDQCPLKCTKPHEVYDPCPPSCPPQTCDSIGKVYPCPHIPEGSEYCNAACRCEQGYYRNSKGECISEKDCLKCTGPNEHFSCGSACDNVCATLSKQNQTNCPIINKKCNPKCYCNEGYARDGNDICIPIEQCGGSCNGDENAIPGCGGYCGRRCSDYKGKPVACPTVCWLDGCDCKDSYVYDDNKQKCVQPKECTPTCGKNEVYSQCINGGCQKKKCSDLGKPDICIDPLKCEEGCLCKDGYLRAANGTCVPIRKCPKPVCKKHEEFDYCANGGCNRRKCSELTGPIICKDVTECIPDCVCVKGYLRDEDGVCVPERKCQPKCDRAHQVFDYCPSTCPPQTCESLNRAYVCPIEWGEDPPCEPGCVCEQGYYKNIIGECNTQEECLQCMGPHEYFACGGACDNVCATLNEQNQTDCPIINIVCNKMCYCEEGYARNASNICIPIKDCPPPRCGPNERYEEYPSMVCEPLYCSEVGKPMDCPPVENPDCEDTPACICKYGLVRNDNGDCVPISECRRYKTSAAASETKLLTIKQ